MKIDAEFHPVTVDRLDDLRRFSESHGKFRYCSCMRWRLTSGEFQRSTKDERIARLEALPGDAIPIGVLGYVDGVPMGWCSVAPRESYRAVERSRAIPRTDNRKVWAVVCFFLDSRVRASGFFCFAPRSSTLATRARRCWKATLSNLVGRATGTWDGLSSTRRLASARSLVPPRRAPPHAASCASNSAPPDNSRQRFRPVHRTLDEQEAAAVLAGYERRNWYAAPVVRRVLSWLVGWRYDSSDDAQRRLTNELPILAFRRA